MSVCILVTVRILVGLKAYLDLLTITKLRDKKNQLSLINPTPVYTWGGMKQRYIMVRPIAGGGVEPPLFWLTDHAKLAAHFGFLLDN